MSFAARWVAREPVLNDEHDDFRWLAPDAIGDLKVTDGLHEVIAVRAAPAPGLHNGPAPCFQRIEKAYHAGLPDPFMSSIFWPF